MFSWKVWCMILCCITKYQYNHTTCTLWYQWHTHQCQQFVFYCFLSVSEPGIGLRLFFLSRSPTSISARPHFAPWRGPALRPKTAARVVVEAVPLPKGTTQEVVVEVAKRLAVVVHPGGRNDAFLVSKQKSRETGKQWQCTITRKIHQNYRKMGNLMIPVWFKNYVG